MVEWCPHCHNSNLCSCKTCLSKAGVSSAKVSFAVVECSYCKMRQDYPHLYEEKRCPYCGERGGCSCAS